MSSDGPGLLASDLAHDVYSEIHAAFRAGASAEEIQKRVNRYESDFSDELDEDSYLAAAVKAYWEIGLSVPAIQQRLTSLLKSGAAYERWSNAIGPKLAAKRREVLRKLLEQTATANPKPRVRPRVGVEPAKAIYEVGECIELNSEGRSFVCTVCAVHPYRKAYVYYLVPIEAKSPSSLPSLRCSRFFGHMIGHYLAPSGYVFGPHGASATQRVLLAKNLQVTRLGKLPLDPSTYTPGGGVGTQVHVDRLLTELDRIRSNTLGYKRYSIAKLLGEA